MVIPKQETKLEIRLAWSVNSILKIVFQKPETKLGWLTT